MNGLIERQEIINRLKRVIEHGAPSQDGTHLVSAEALLEAFEDTEIFPSIQPSPIWHSIEEPPSDDRKVLVSFAHFSQPMIGRFEGNPDDGYTAYIGDEDETFVENDLLVDGWWELPKKPEGE